MPELFYTLYNYFVNLIVFSHRRFIFFKAIIIKVFQTEKKKRVLNNLFILSLSSFPFVDH